MRVCVCTWERSIGIFVAKVRLNKVRQSDRIFSSVRRKSERLRVVAVKFAYPTEIGVLLRIGEGDMLSESRRK